MSNLMPLLQDIDLTRYQFDPGDGVIVRVGYDYSPDYQKRIMRAVTKFCGEDVRIILVNCMKQRFTRISEEGSIKVLVDQSQGYRMPVLKSGQQIEVNCSVIQFQKNDVLSVELKEFAKGLYLERIRSWIEHWTGSDVEVRIAQGLFLAK